MNKATNAHQSVKVTRMLVEQALATHQSIKQHPALRDGPDGYRRIVMQSCYRIARRVKAWGAAIEREMEMNR